MKNILFLFTIVLSLVSCTNTAEKTESETSYLEYFYPTDSLIPFIYVFQNSKNPLDEKIQRIYRSETDDVTGLVVEYFNADMKITEGYTHDLNDGLKVIDHMIVDGDGKKRKAKLTTNTFFPLSKDEETMFISDFPSHLDSITMIYQSKRRVLEENKTVNVLGEQVKALIIEDSVKVLFANPFTQKSSAQSVMITRTFAKGYGLVKWSANNEEIVYELKSILTNEWWDEYGQTPQIVR